MLTMPTRELFSTRALRPAALQPGPRPYLLIKPAETGRPAPLLVMLHGCTQTAVDFSVGTRMGALGGAAGCLVCFPEQAPRANSQRCWNWFSPGDQVRDGGEPALIAGIVRAIGRDHAVDERRIYVAGLSAGGAAAAVLGSAYPDVFAAVGVHSGLACGSAHDLPSALAAMRSGRGDTPARGSSPPTIVFHGDADATVNARNADAVIGAALPREWAERRIRRGLAPRGRAFTVETYHVDGSVPVAEKWVVHGGGHAWSGGDAAGSHTDPSGPDASAEMLRFLLAHRRRVGPPEELGPPTVPSPCA